MEEKDKIIVKWAQEDMETSNNLLNNNNNVYGVRVMASSSFCPIQLADTFSCEGSIRCVS